MLKFIHITDTHLLADDAPLYGISPWGRLDACFRHIQSWHEDAAFVAITGDIAEKGSAAAYRRLDGAAKSAGLKVVLTAGNHDNTANMQAALPAFSGGLEALTPGAWTAACLSSAAGACVFLDTTSPQASHGTFDRLKARDLQQRLSGQPARNIFLFMHHPPFSVGIPFMDVVCLLDPEPLYAVLAQFRSKIRHMFMGHLHKTINGAWRGLPFSIIRSTVHQISAKMSLYNSDVDYAAMACDETPEYSVVIINGDKVICNAERFAENASAFPIYE